MSSDIIHTTIQQTWDQIAESFDKTRTRPWSQCIDFIQTIPKDYVVGDFACGNGRHTLEIARYCKKVIAIDLSSNLLHIIQNKNIEMCNIELIHGNLLNLPLQNDCLDSVLYIASLHNIPKKENRIRSLKELYRVIKPMGTALLSVWSKQQEKFTDAPSFVNDQGFSKDMIEKGDVFIYWNQDKLHVPRFYHLYEKQEIISELKQTGFSIVSINEEMISTKNKVDNYFIIIRK